MRLGLTARDRQMPATTVPKPAPPTDTTIYRRNLRLLWRFDAQLARRIDAIADSARHPVEPSRSGAWTVALPAADGRPAYLHSRYDPEAEAAKLIDGVETEGQYCFFVSGFGLGYHLQALRERIAPDAIIVVVESDLRLVAAALACVDLSEVLAEGRLTIITDEDKARLHERLQPQTALIMLGARFVSHPPSQRVAADFHQAMRRLLTEFVAFARTSLVTLVNNAQITCRNVANNIGTYAATSSIDVLDKRFANRPAVVVSAGPSLRRNIDQLIAARDRVIVIALQTTLKTLLEHGITPDFVTSLDYHEVSRQYYEGIEALEDIHLVAEPKATWHVLDDYPGPVSILDNSFARLLIGEELAPRAPLPPGATVAHLAFYLARYMGCDPIILIGQDLAYTGYVYYSPGMEIHRSWDSEINRFNTMETKEWERTARMGNMLRTTVDAEGRKVYSDDLLMTYLEQFERDIMQTSGRVINATEGGARIRGAEHLPLAETLTRFAAESIPRALFAYRQKLRGRDTTILPRVRDELTARRDEVRHLAKLCDQMRDVLRELKGLTDQPDRFNRRLVRVDELRAQVHQASRAYRIINAVAQLSELRRFSADRELTAGRVEGVERAKRQLKRDLEFVGGIREGARSVEELLEEALGRVAARIETGTCP
jgi:hypothetical protein